MEKLFEGTLIVNWKTKEMRVLKKPISKIRSQLSPSDIPIRIKLTLLIPDPKEIVATGRIEIPDNKVMEMVIEEI